LSLALRGGAVMNVLVICEESGATRDAFRLRGHNAWSCDILPGEGIYPEFHYIGDECWQDDARLKQWDLIIAHPPCTFLANSGVRWLYQGGKRWTDAGKTRENPPDQARWDNMRKGAHFFIKIWQIKDRHPSVRLAVENPIIHEHAHKFGIPQHTQLIQPWQFGHGETKATCLWLYNLPKLIPTNIVEGRVARVHLMSPGPERGRERGHTYSGISTAFAEQWGCL